MKLQKSLILVLVFLGIIILISQQFFKKELCEIDVNSYHQDNTRMNNVTVVTLYFQLENSKHPPSNYEKWFQNFLPQIETPMVIFTENSSAAMLSSLRGKKPTILVILSSHWEAWPNIHFRKAFERSAEIDPEVNIRNIDLYAVWNMKPWILAEAARLNHFNSKYFVYTDAGAFRQPDHISLFRNWPDVEVLDEVFRSNGSFVSSRFFNGVLFGLPRNPWKRDDVLCHQSGKTLQGSFIQGGTLACTYLSCEGFSNRYYEHILPLRVERDWFIGSEQRCFHHYVATYPLDSFLIDARKIEPSCGSNWFYYQQWLANGEERVQGCTRTELKDASELIH